MRLFVPSQKMYPAKNKHTKYGKTNLILSDIWYNKIHIEENMEYCT